MDNTYTNIYKEENENGQIVFDMIGESASRISVNDDFDSIITACELRVQEMNDIAASYQNNADKYDYLVAAGIGLITGIIDITVIGDFNFEAGKKWSNKAVNDYIMKIARKTGYKGRSLSGAIDHLEKKHPVAQDNIFHALDHSTPSTHHLDDLAHHPTLLGLISGIIVHFFRVSMFSEKDGKFTFLTIETDPKELIKIWAPVVASLILTGILQWILNIVENKLEDKLDRTIPEGIRKIVKLIATTPALIPVIKVIINWSRHLVSDMAGCKSTAGGGMGIPGVFLSLLREIAMLPGLNNTKLPQIITDWYSKRGGYRFDLRKELAVVHELGKQAIPVIINEVVVRGFYFVRHFCEEYKSNNGFENINWENVIPFGNRTVEHMIFISSATFSALDVCDATIRGLVSSGGNPAAFAKTFALRINYAGVCRFTVAVITEINMGYKESTLQLLASEGEARGEFVKAAAVNREINQERQKRKDTVDSMISDLDEL